MENIIMYIIEALFTIVVAYVLGLLYIQNWYYPKIGNPIRYKVKSLLYCFIYLFCFYVWIGSYNILWLFGISCILLELENMKFISKNASLLLYVIIAFLSFTF